MFMRCIHKLFCYHPCTCKTVIFGKICQLRLKIYLPGTSSKSQSSVLWINFKIFPELWFLVCILNKSSKLRKSYWINFMRCRRRYRRDVQSIISAMTILTEINDTCSTVLHHHDMYFPDVSDLWLWYFKGPL